MGYTQQIRVRYGECDMQGVVFNANYFVYCDDVVDTWTRLALKEDLLAAGHDSDLHVIGFDFMLKNTNLTWNAPVRFGDTIDMQASVKRWGHTSFDIEIRGLVGAQERFMAVITYVSVDPVTLRPTPVAQIVKMRLS